MAVPVRALQTNQPHGRAKPDRRRHYRVQLTLQGRFLVDGQDHSLVTKDISCGGAFLRSDTQPPIGTTLICYLDGLGRIAAGVVRHDEDGFAVEFDASPHKRDKLADRLLWLVNEPGVEIQEQRTAERQADGSSAEVELSDGTVISCRVMDISLSGASFETRHQPPRIGDHVRTGKLQGEVVRAAPGEFAIRFLHRSK